MLTHEPPEDPPDPEIRFLTDGIEAAVATAAGAAGGGNLQIFGASMARQCLHENLLDEIVVHIAPVMLGEGVRFYDAAGATRVNLEPLLISRSDATADLRYAVRRGS